MLKLLAIFLGGAMIGAAAQRVTRRLARSVPSGQERWEMVHRDLAVGTQRTIP